EALLSFGQAEIRSVFTDEPGFGEQVGILQRDGGQRAQVLGGSQNRLASGILAGGAHAGVVELDQLLVSRGARVFALKQLPRPCQRLRLAVMRAVAGHTGGAVQQATATVLADEVARLLLEDHREVAGVVEDLAGAGAGLGAPARVDHLQQRLSEVGQCGVLVAVVEVGDPLGTTDDPRDLGLVLEQEVIQQGAGRLLVAGVQDLAHLPFPRRPERVPVALAATVLTGRRARSRRRARQGLHRPFSFASTGQGVDGNPLHTGRSPSSRIRPWEMKASRTAKSLLPRACSSRT